MPALFQRLWAAAKSEFAICRRHPGVYRGAAQGAVAAAKIYGDGEQTRDFCFVQNVVNANLLAATTERKLAGESMNIACGQRISLNAMLAKMEALLNTHVRPEYLPARAGDVRDSLADISAAASLIGYKPSILFEEGLQQTVRAYATPGA